MRSTGAITGVGRGWGCGKVYEKLAKKIVDLGEKFRIIRRKGKGYQNINVQIKVQTKRRTICLKCQWLSQLLV